MSQLIPWNDVYLYYISSETVSYADCARKFDIAVSSVKDHGSAEKWTEKKQQVFKAALAIMEERTAHEIAKRNEEHVKQARLLQGAGLEAIAEGNLRPTSFDDARKAIETGQKLERAALGMEQKVGGKVEITNPGGQKIHVTWGNGEELNNYDKQRREVQANEPIITPDPIPETEPQDESQPG